MQIFLSEVLCVCVCVCVCVIDTSTFKITFHTKLGNFLTALVSNMTLVEQMCKNTYAAEE